VITKNIRSVGIEVEGGIDLKDKKYLEDFLEEKGIIDRYCIGTDASVQVYSKEFSDAEIKFWDDNKERFLEVIRVIYSLVKQNSTCGNHLHFRFKDDSKMLSLLSYRQIWKYFIDEYKKYALSFESENKKQKYLSRLENKYCIAKYNENVVIYQLISKSKCSERYRAINLNSYNVHNTIEIRILPYFESVEEAIKSICWLIDIMDRIYRKRYLTVEENINIFDYIHLQPPSEYVIKIEKMKIRVM